MANKIKYIVNITKVGSDWDVTSLQNSNSDLKNFDKEVIPTFNWPGSLKQWYLSYNNQYATALANVCESWPELRGNFNSVPGFAGYKLVYIPNPMRTQGEQAETTSKTFRFRLFAVVNNNQYIQNLGSCTVTVELNKPVEIAIIINNISNDSFDPNNVDLEE